ncbi:hypothetical protein KW798_01205 [Candidatus Parcubacteria bacterium]|nr:hypothetical protein [Candidatus Parcubacteria bacterium]
MLSAAITVVFALAFAVSFIAFFWGAVIYLWNAGTQEEGRRHGKSILLMGATMLVLLMLLFGAVQWIGGKMGVEVFRTQ